MTLFYFDIDMFANKLKTTVGKLMCYGALQHPVIEYFTATTRPQVLYLLLMMQRCQGLIPACWEQWWSHAVKKEHRMLCSASQLVKWAVVLPSTRMAEGTAGNQSQSENTVCLVFSLHTATFVQVSSLHEIRIFPPTLFPFQGCQIKHIIVYTECVLVFLWLPSTERSDLSTIVNLAEFDLVFVIEMCSPVV